MLKIVQIANRPQGSVGNIVVLAARGFVKAGHAVTNIFIKGPVDDLLPLPSAPSCEFVSYADVFTKHGKHAAIRAISDLLRQKGCDVLLSHNYHPCKFAYQASRRLAIDRKIAVFHGLGSLKRRRRKIFAWLFLRKWLFAGVSQAVAQDIIDSGAVFKAHHVHVVGNGLDLKALEAAQLDRQAARERLDLPRDDFIFGNIGRLSDSKNQAILIEAYARIVGKLPPSRLVIIGEGRKQDELLAVVAEHRLEDRVIFKGFVPDAQLCLKAFDLFLFPSRSEAFGLALLEAMIARVPAIVSDVGGISELVGAYPFTIRPDDVQDLARQMMAMAEKSARERNQIASTLHARATDGYDINQMEDAYLKIIAWPQ